MSDFSPDALLRERPSPPPHRSRTGDVAKLRRATSRPVVRGKFLYADDGKYWVKGVTYGTFAPDAYGQPFPNAAQVERDFAQMARAGMNTVRVYTVPPRTLLDAAHRHGLKVMVGLPWEQHIAFLDEAGRPEAIERRVRDGVQSCARHPALFCYAVGNEIRHYVQRSRGEFAVAKNVYVATRSGWFSCSSVCHLAAGLPIVVQDTGSEVIPCGEGVLAFSTLDEAADALCRAEADYPRHQAAARRIAQDHFSSERVLGRCSQRLACARRWTRVSLRVRGTTLRS